MIISLSDGSAKCDNIQKKPLKEYIHINNMIDEDMRSLRRLKHKYDINTTDEVQNLYLINPKNSTYKSRFVKPDASMFMLDVDYEKALGDDDNMDFRINPNTESKEGPCQDGEYMLYPKSNIPIKKKDYDERQHIKLYPHMFVPTVTQTDTHLNATIGGADYPIPMRFRLNFLQDSSKDTDDDNIDYDIKLASKGRAYPQNVLAKNLDMNRRDNIDFYFTKNINNNIADFHRKHGNVHNDVYRKRGYGRTVGVPQSDNTHLSCERVRREKAHTMKILGQQTNCPHGENVNGAGIEIQCNRCTIDQTDRDNQDYLLKPMSKQEKDIFNTPVDRRRPQYAQYPSKTAQKPGFFGLGPVIPPPNPLLLSNVSSEKIISPETFIGNVTPNNCKHDYKKRNISLEHDIQKKIKRVVNQQLQVMKQISDARHIIPLLKQRELTAKDKSDVQDIHTSINRFENVVYILNQLRQIQSFLQTQQKKLLQRLEDVMPVTIFRKYQTKLKNEIAFYQAGIKRYHEMPEDDEIHAFIHEQYNGDIYKMKKGFYDYPYVGGLQNNALKSLKIGKNVSVILYSHANRKGKLFVYHGPRRIDHIPLLMSKNISGIEIIKKTSDTVQIFDAPFFQGGRSHVSHGFYDYPDVGGIGQGNLKSLIIPRNMRVKLFSRPKQQGETIEFLGPQRLSFLPGGWGKKVFGIEISPKNSDY